MRPISFFTHCLILRALALTYILLSSLHGCTAQPPLFPLLQPKNVTYAPPLASSLYPVSATAGPDIDFKSTSLPPSLIVDPDPITSHAEFLDDDPLWRPWEINGSSSRATSSRTSASTTGQANVNTDSLTTQIGAISQDFGSHFKVEKHPDYPWAILKVLGPTNAQVLGFSNFRINYTDLSSTDGSTPPASYPITITDPKAGFKLFGLHPGHEYSVIVVGQVSDTDTYMVLKEERIIMDTVVPDFDGTNASVETTTDSITLRALKAPSALQDYFLIECIELEAPATKTRHEPMTVRDIAEQRSIELYIARLSAGTNYNVTVTAVKGDVVSAPWEKIITTIPFRPMEPAATDLRPTTIALQWKKPKSSGVDRYSVKYGPANENATLIEVNDITLPSIQLSEGLFPGKRYAFALYAEKGSQISTPTPFHATMKPLPPSSIDAVPDYVHKKFRVVLDIASEDETLTDSCVIQTVSDSLDKQQLTAPVEQTGKNGQRSCSALVTLIPGNRYEIAGWSVSDNTTSDRKSANVALKPAFNMHAFGLTLNTQLDNAISLDWPTGEMEATMLSDLWDKLVGRESKVHLRVEEVNGAEEATQLDGSPDPESPPLIADQLRAGACYTAQVYTVTSSGIVSANRTVRNIRLSPPAANVTLSSINKTNCSLSITVEQLRHQQKQQKHESQCQLNITTSDLQGANEVVDQRSVPLSSQQITIELSGLKPYHRYLTSALIICGSQRSRTQADADTCAESQRILADFPFQTAQDRPGPVTGLSVVPIQPFMVKLAWRPPLQPNGRILHYMVDVLPANDFEKPWNKSVAGQVAFSAGGEQVLETVVDGLVGGQRYDFVVTAVTEAGRGLVPKMEMSSRPPVRSRGDAYQLTMPIRAPPTPPGELEILRNTVRSTDLSIRFSSDMFDTKHGLLTKYAVIVAQVANNEIESQEGAHFDGSEDATIFVKDLTNKTSTWGQVRMLPVWPAYVAVVSPIEARKIFHDPPRTITEVIGVDESCAYQPLDMVCNGPLKPGRSYRIKLRLYTGPGLWSDSRYSQLVITEHASSDGGRTILLVLFSLFSLTAVGVCVCLVVNRRRKLNNTSTRRDNSAKARSNQLNNTYSNGKTRNGFANGYYDSGSQESVQTDGDGCCPGLVLNMADRAAECLAKLGIDGVAGTSNGLAAPNCHHRRSKSLRERTGVDARLERLPSGPPPGHRLSSIPLFTVVSDGVSHDQSRPVRKIDFSEHVRLMSADSDFRFSEEYEDLKQVGRSQTCIASDLPVNRAKNRFTNVLPYDHSRVKLIAVDDDDGSDYINASYIPGFNSRREFIAAQGPLPSTRDHFWRMVWEQQCPSVVALTKCVEKGRDKCHQYWPDNGELSVTYADIEVTLMNETAYDEFVIREFRLTHLTEGASRTIRHCHYMAWPDFGVPEKAAGIVNFVRLFRQRNPPSKTCKPTVVHCSAGVGRSGTFIALDWLMQSIVTEDTIDIFGIVHNMRKERVSMVQTEQQYIFIHSALLYVLDGRERENNFAYSYAHGSLQSPPASGVFSNNSINNSTTVSSNFNGSLSTNGALHSTSSPTKSVHSINSTDSSSPSSCHSGQSRTSYGTKAVPVPVPVVPGSIITTIMSNNKSLHSGNNGNKLSNGQPPRIEVHQNPAFVEDDEGIAESGV